MMKKNVVIIGGGVMQVRLVENALSMGLSPVVADKNPSALAFGLLGVESVIVDISNPTDTLNAVVSHFKNKGNSPVACLTCGTDFPQSVSLINEHYGLNGVSTQSAKIASNKILMRECFAKHGVFQPRFVGLQKEEVLNFKASCLNELTYPLVVKPTDNMGARGVKLADTLDDVIAHLPVAMASSRKGEVIIEEKIEGYEYSLDALVMNGEIHITGFADRIIVGEPYRVEMGHHLPTHASKDIQEAVVSVFKQAVLALGVQDGFAKGDVFYDTKSRRGSIGEVAVRLSGGYMSSYTYHYSSGVNLMKNALLLAMRRYDEIDLTPKDSYHCLERAIVATKKGRIVSINGVEEAKKIDGVLHVFLLRKVGDEVDTPIDNVSKLGNIIVRHKSFEEAEKIAQRVLKTIIIDIT